MVGLTVFLAVYVNPVGGSSLGEEGGVLRGTEDIPGVFLGYVAPFQAAVAKDVFHAFVLEGQVARAVPGDAPDFIDGNVQRIQQGLVGHSTRRAGETPEFVGATRIQRRFGTVVIQGTHARVVVQPHQSPLPAVEFKHAAVVCEVHHASRTLHYFPGLRSALVRVLREIPDYGIEGRSEVCCGGKKYCQKYFFHIYVIVRTQFSIFIMKVQISSC